MIESSQPRGVVYVQGTADLSDAVHQLEMMRLRGELTPDAVADMMAQYVNTASTAAASRSQQVSFVLADANEKLSFTVRHDTISQSIHRNVFTPNQSIAYSLE